MIERDIILTHQSGCKLRGVVDGAAKIVAPVHTHLDPDGRPVSLAFVISMLSSFVSRQALVNGMIVDREMPGEKSSAIGSWNLDARNIRVMLLILILINFGFGIVEALE
jgi:hypothetical protein